MLLKRAARSFLAPVADIRRLQELRTGIRFKASAQVIADSDAAFTLPVETSLA